MTNTSIGSAISEGPDGKGLDAVGTNVGITAKPARLSTKGLGILRGAATAWWVAAFAGHMAFGAYILGTYGAATMHGDRVAWNRVWPTGFVPAKPVGNLLVVIHVLLASVVAICGPLQLIPMLRRRAPWFHRWNGRIYSTVAIVVGLAGLAMLASNRGFVGASQNGSVAINGILLVMCAVLAWRSARARAFAEHRKWALRLFVLAAGVWFFRIGLAAWIAVNKGIVGFNPATMQGPALLTLALAEWMVPLAVIEAYFRVEAAHHAIGRYMVAALVLMLALATGYGTYRAAVGMWLPAIVGH